MMLVLLAACAGEPADDTGGADTGPCADAPALTWENFGEGFLVENCQGCHASGATDRHGAPAEAFFDTVDNAWAWKDPILAVSTGEAPTMPPSGGATADDRTRLGWWLECGTPGT
jgi:hypothetical protein